MLASSKRPDVILRASRGAGSGNELGGPVLLVEEGAGFSRPDQVEERIRAPGGGARRNDLCALGRCCHVAKI